MIVSGEGNDDCDSGRESVDDDDGGDDDGDSDKDGGESGVGNCLRW